MAGPDAVVEALPEAPVETRAFERHQPKPAWVRDDVGDVVRCERVEGLLTVDAYADREAADLHQRDWRRLSDRK